MRTPEADRFRHECEVPDPPLSPKGRQRYWDETVFEAVAESVSHAKLTTLLLPGIGTVHDLKRAFGLGVRLSIPPRRWASP